MRNTSTTHRHQPGQHFLAAHYGTIDFSISDVYRCANKDSELTEPLADTMTINRRQGFKHPYEVKRKSESGKYNTPFVNNTSPFR